MIEGIQATVSAEELRELCLKHARQHEASVQKLTRELEGGKGRKKKTRTRREMEDDTLNLIGYHSNKALEMKFFADHLEPGEKYMLDRNDLCQLGIIQEDREFNRGWSDPFEDEIPF